MLKAVKQVGKPLAFTITSVLVTFRPYSPLSCFVLLFCGSNWRISSSLDCLVLTRPQDIVFIFLYHPHLFQTVPINCFSVFTRGTCILPKLEAKMQWVMFFPVLPSNQNQCCQLLPPAAVFMTIMKDLTGSLTVSLEESRYWPLISITYLSPIHPIHCNWSIQNQSLKKKKNTFNYIC